jgi:2-oxo-3-hexenedioate decarboxylase
MQSAKPQLAAACRTVEFSFSTRHAMSPASVAAIAEELIALHDAPRIVPPCTARYPELDGAQGYAAARALHAHRLARGWRPAGRKIGFTNRTIWPRYGVYEPIWGWVYDRTLLEARAGRAVVSLAGLLQPRIEPEVCFKLKSAPPRGASAEALLDAIEWIAHSIEIVDCPHPNWRFKLGDCTANNGLHAGLVVGTQLPVAELRGLAGKLPSLQLTLFKADAVVDRGVGANVLGSPLLALAHLVELLAREPDSPALAAGEIVSTGVLTDAHPIAPGETWRTALDGLPLAGLEVSFT